MTATLVIPIHKIRAGKNPRKRFDAESLNELAASIREHGVIQPVIVEPDGKGYILVAGERRLRASRIAGLDKIPVIVRERSNHNGRERFVVSLIENDQREDMNPMDRAEAYQSLRDDYGMSIQEISIKTSKQETIIRNFLELNKLDEEIKELLRKGWWKDTRLTKALLAITDKTARVELAKRLHANKVSLRGCLVSCGKLQSARRKVGRPSTKMNTPSLRLARETEADETQKPPRWDMLRQAGKVPAWEAVVQSAEQTCSECPLRDMASPTTCGDCGAVQLIRLLVENAR